MPETEKSGVPAGDHPESPTTARELDFDDDEAGMFSPVTSHPPNISQVAEHGSESAPAKPPRPMSPQEQAESTLKEAFPDIDPKVVKAVLVASGGKVEPAFNALLGMSDPNAQIDAPPPQPPRPRRTATVPTSTTQSQLEADERYARQLAEHYNSPAVNRQPGWADPTLPRRRKEMGLKPNELYDDREHSFIDDDLPVIKENIRKGFLETQSKVNNWVANLKKKLDGEEEEYQGQPSRQAGVGGPAYPSRRVGDGGRARASGDYQRYDADPRVLGDDFSHLELRDSEVEQQRSRRPLANPNLFKPTPPAPESGRRVSFQETMVQVETPYGASSDKVKRSASTGTKASKWQPLTTVEPTPVTDHDPFSLGDSDDEKETKSKDLKVEEAEKQQNAAAGTSLENVGSRAQGSKEKQSEEKLAGKT